MMKKYTPILKAIANSNRLKILSLLNKEELNVGKLEKYLNLSQSALSQHLAVLRKANIVKTRRNAQTIYYRLENNIVRQILNLLA